MKSMYSGMGKEAAQKEVIRNEDMQRLHKNE